MDNKNFSCCTKETHSMSETAKVMEIGNEQTETGCTMPGGNMSSGRSDDGSGGMPGGNMSSGRSDDGGGGMPGGGMNGDGSGGSGDGGGMPGGGMNGDGSGGSDDGGETPRSRICATMDVHRRLLSRFPSYAKTRDEIENLTLSYANNPEAAQRSGVTRIPVVVHVVWNTSQQNISDAQIHSQIDVLNRDFRRTNPDISNTPAPFLPLTADARIEFFLANIDPNGAPSTGINRRQTTVASFGSNDAVKS